MAKVRFLCSRTANGGTCPNNPGSDLTGAAPGEFVLTIQSYWEGAPKAQLALAPWQQKGIRCGCGAAFASITMTDPNLPDVLEPLEVDDDEPPQKH